MFGNPWSPLTRVRDEEADLKIIALGTNDIKNGVVITGDVTAYRTNMAAMIDAAKLKSDVLVLTPPPQAVDVGNSSYERQQSFRQALFALCEEKKVPLLDLYGWLGDFDYADAQGWMDDTLHTSVEGDAIWAAAELQYMRRVG